MSGRQDAHGGAPKARPGGEPEPARRPATQPAFQPKAGGANASRHVHAFAIPDDVTALAQVRQEVTAAIHEGGFPESLINRILIAVDEAVTNIIEHGYDGREHGKSLIDIRVEVDVDEFMITIVDQGEAFDPRTMSDVDIERHVAAGRTGGLGVFLIRKIMDVVDYHHETGRHNKLTMIKRR